MTPAEPRAALSPMVEMRSICVGTDDYYQTGEEGHTCSNLLTIPPRMPPGGAALLSGFNSISMPTWDLRLQSQGHTFWLLNQDDWL